MTRQCFSSVPYSAAFNWCTTYHAVNDTVVLLPVVVEAACSGALGRCEGGREEGGKYGEGWELHCVGEVWKTGKNVSGDGGLG